jgi:hypothetical protein
VVWRRSGNRAIAEIVISLFIELIMIKTYPIEAEDIEEKRHKP